MVKYLAVFLAATVVILTAEIAAAQGETPSCASKLMGCLNYLNATTTPPTSCCNPLKEAVTNERTCLCNIYNNPNLVKTFQINITQALNLPKLCHIDTGKSPDICKGVPTSPSSSSSPSASGKQMDKFVVVLVVALLVVLTATLAKGQTIGETPPCVPKLTPCVNYLNATTTPPASCCNPLKEVVTNEKECVCSIYNNPALIQALRINITQALNIPKLCNIDIGSKSLDDTCRGNANDAGRITGTGLVVAMLLMFGAYSMLY